MSNYLTPGVYTILGDLQYPNQQAGLSSAGIFVGLAKRGKIGQAYTFTTPSQVRNVIGKSADSKYSYDAIQYAFKNGMTHCHFMRTAHYTDIDDATTLTALEATGTITDATGDDILVISALGEGVDYHAVKPRIQKTPLAAANTAGYFDLFIYDNNEAGNSVVVEKFENVSINPNDRRYVKFIVNNLSNIIQIDSVVTYDATTKTGPAWGSSTYFTVTLSGGDDGLTDLDSTDYIGSSQSQTGLYGFNALQTRVAAVCIPGLMAYNTFLNSESGTGYPSLADAKTYWDRVESAIDELDYFFFIGDAPYNQNPTAVSNFKEGISPDSTPLNSMNCAMFYPFVEAYNLADDDSQVFPVSPFVIGKASRVASDIGLHQSPAGEYGVLDQVKNLKYHVTFTEHGLLNSVNVNVIKKMPDWGYTIMGAKTNSENFLYKYINTVRMLGQIRYDLDKATQFALFKNVTDENVWMQAKLACERVLKIHFDAGRLAGTTVSEAFTVQCDSNTNSATGLAQGVLRIVVKVALHRPAEFIEIEIFQDPFGLLSEASNAAIV